MPAPFLLVLEITLTLKIIERNSPGASHILAPFGRTDWKWKFYFAERNFPELRKHIAVNIDCVN